MYTCTYYLYYIYTYSICYTSYLLLQDPTLLMSKEHRDGYPYSFFVDRTKPKRCKALCRLGAWRVSPICSLRLRILMCGICLCSSNWWHLLLKIDGGQWTNSDNFGCLPRVMWASMGVNHEPMPLLWTTSHFFNMSHWRLQDLQQQLSVLTEERDLARATWPSCNHWFLSFWGMSWRPICSREWHSYQYFPHMEHLGIVDYKIDTIKLTYVSRWKWTSTCTVRPVGMVLWCYPASSYKVGPRSCRNCVIFLV